MTKRVRDDSTTLYDYNAQSLEVARQVGTCLLMIRIDHLNYNDCTRNLLLNDLVIDFVDELGANSATRDSNRSNSPDCVTHAMVNDCSLGIPRSVFQADTIIRSCELANFEQFSGRHIVDR